MKPNLNWLLAFIPVALGLWWAEAKSVVVFASSSLALVPLAALTGEAADVQSEYVGPTWGGLLGATQGNAPEIIIGDFALRQGLVTVVKSSVVGSIVGNLLLVWGCRWSTAG